jgi:hypothetical protein
MKVELNPEKLWPIVDALDDNANFSCKAEGRIGKRSEILLLMGCPGGSCSASLD